MVIILKIKKKHSKISDVLKVNVFRGLTLKFFSVFFIITIVSVIIIAVLPFSMIKDYISDNKEQEMTNLARNFQNMLESYYNRFDEKDIEDVYEIMDYESKGKLIITDTSGKIIFDSAAENNTDGRVLLLTEVFDALKNQPRFNAVFNTDYFDFSIAYPIVLRDNVQGCFYLKQRDTEQCGRINRLKYLVFAVCFFVLIFSVILILILLVYMRRQINEMNNLIYNVKQGNYETEAKVISEDELGHLAIEFNSMALRLKNIEERRRRFVSDASHELKTPLATIKVLSEYILSCDDKNIDINTVREFMGDINSEIDRLTRVSDELIKLTKIDSGAQDIAFKLTGVNVLKILERISRMLKNYADVRGISIIFDCDSKYTVKATEDGLYEVLFNIIENAVKYNKDGGYVKIEVRDYNKNMTAIYIKDNGIGIPEEDADKIFERFYRVDKARSRDTGGTGLGLSVANDFVKAFGGRISVSSVLNKGTQFVIILSNYQNIGEN